MYKKAAFFEENFMRGLKILANYPIYRIKKSINVSHGGD